MELSFPESDSRFHAVVGEENYLTERELRKLRPGYLIATPEPKNKFDRNAVVMHDLAGRKIGYMSAGLAKSYQPLIVQTGPVKLPMHREGKLIKYKLPTLSALKSYVKSL